MLRLVLAAQIAAAAIVTCVLIAAGNNTLHFPEPWHTIYQRVFYSLAILPIAATVCLLFWIFRANKNARALSAQALEYSPGWAVGWFFVPIAAFWKPYEVMREIYKASRTPPEWRKTKGAAFLGWWWVIQLIGNFTAIALVLVRSGSDMLVIRHLSLALYAAMAMHQALLLIITARIDKWQAAAHRSGGVEAIF